MPRLAALLDGHHYQLVDHLAPLCNLLDMPLIIESPQIKSHVDQYYPNVTCHLLDPIDLSLAFLEENFDILFTSLYYAATSLQDRLSRNLLFIFCPHGNSDKSMDIFLPQSHTLIYGPQMASRMPPHLQTLLIGNYRRHYFETNQKPFSKTKTRILFAPSWETPDFSLYEKLITSCPSDFELIVKPHAITEKRHFAHATSLAEKYPENFLIEMPAIYPLLASCDYYVGDRSSIGYDFLAFNRPLFFLTNESHPLHSIGNTIQGDLFNTIRAHQDTQLSARQKLYNEVFAPVNPEIKHEIIQKFEAHQRG